MKKALNSMLLTILITSMFSAALVALITPAYSATAGTLEVSTTQFWGNATVQVRLYDPDLNINASERDFATLSVTFNCANSSIYGPTPVYANESLTNSGEFYFYFANASISDGTAIAGGVGDKNVTNPPYGNSYYNYTWALSPNDQIVITYYDQSPVAQVSATVTFAEYVATAEDLSFDRAGLEYPMNGYMKVNVKDLDWNLDPTAPDSVNLNISLCNPVNGNTTSSILNFTETGRNTALFTNTTSYYTSTNFGGYTYNLTDLLNTTAPIPIKVTYENETDAPPYKYITFKTFSVSLEVPSTFTTSGDLTITVSDPNFDHKSWAKEHFGQFGNTNVTITIGNETLTLNSTMVETDYASGAFKAVAPVKIGQPTNDGILQVNTTQKTAKIVYYANNTLKADTVSTLSTTPATIATDKTMYKKDATVKITLNASDLNDDTGNINYLTCILLENNATINALAVNCSTVVVGNLTIKVNGLLAKYNSTASDALTFVETGVNTGVFTANLGLTKILKYDNSSLINGDTVTISYYDNFNAITTTATFTIGVAAASISLDRSTYPVPKDGGVKVYITVTDSEANKDPSTIETIKAGDGKAFVDLYCFNGTLAAGNSTAMDLTESGPNTGIFTGTYTLNQTDLAALINGWVKALYVDPASGKNITAMATLTATDASVSVDKATAKAGDTITVTVNDPDRNLNSKSKDTGVIVTYKYTNTSGVEATGALSLEETGANTGIFTGTITIGSTAVKVKPGTTITFTYKDNSPSYVTAASGYATVDRTATVTVPSNTGVLTTDKTEYGPGSKMTITVNDPDLNTDVTSIENINVTLRLYNGTDIIITLLEDGANSAVFKNATYTWSSGDKGIIGQPFYVYYKDVADASGKTVYAVVTGTVKSWDGEVSFEKAYYNIGDVVVVTVKDQDANKDPSKIENVQVKVTSSSDPIGQTITATETDVNTGVFVGRVQISSSLETGKVLVKYGDTLTASYTDDLPADYATTEKPKTFTGTATVGVPVARPVPASSQKFVDPNTGAEKTSGKVGEAIGLQATVKNVDVVSRPFTAIFKVKNSAGATIFISWISGTLQSGQELTPAVSWTPTLSGTYTVEVLVVKSLSEPTPYSDKLSMELPVT